MNVSHEAQSPNNSQGLDLIGFLICEVTGTTIPQIKSNMRTKKITHARALISQMARSQSFTFSEIGEWMNKDHTAIVHHMGMDL